jgi:hypothetical protein
MCSSRKYFPMGYHTPKMEVVCKSYDPRKLRYQLTQTYGQTEVVNQMIVHIMCMYNSYHPRTWDEIIPYVHQYYNMDLHSSTGHSPFQVGLGFQPLCHIDVALPLASTQEKYSHVQSEADKATIFIEWIQHIHQQVHDILQKANAKYKQDHDQHWVPNKCQV